MSSRITPIPGIQVPADTPGAEMASTAMGIWARRPEIAAAFGGVYAALDAESATLDARLAELVRLRIAFHNQCRTCMSARMEPDLVDEDLVCSLERPEEAADLTAAEQAAVRFADLFATDHLAIDDDLVDELREHFDEGEIVELSGMCALYVGIGRLMAVWHVVDGIPESFRAPKGERLTPWGHDDAVISPRQARGRIAVGG